MFCQKCGNQISEQTKFCPKCGASIALSGQLQKPSAPSAAYRQTAADAPVSETPKKGFSVLAVLAGVMLLLIVCSAAFVLGSNRAEWLPTEAQTVDTLHGKQEEVREKETDEAGAAGPVETAAAVQEAAADTQEMAAEMQADVGTQEMAAGTQAAADTQETIAGSQKSAASIAAEPTPEALSSRTYDTMYVVNCHESISLRTSPSTSAAAIRQIPYGEAVSYIGTSENGFYKISYHGDTGYSLASYLSYHSAPPKTNAYSSQTYDTMYVVNCRESISLRTSPSTSAAAIRQIPYGEAVSYIGTSENGFYKISYHGDTGYSLASYLSYHPAPAKTNTYTTMWVVNCKESITLRTSPSTAAAEICQIPLGAAVSYINTSSNGFYMVSYLGKTGYALASYLSN